RDLALLRLAQRIGGETERAVEDRERGTEDAAVLDLLDHEARVLAELDGAALAHAQLHARIRAGTDAVARDERRARRERHGAPAALEPCGILHRLDARRLGERRARRGGERDGGECLVDLHGLRLQGGFIPLYGSSGGADAVP